MSVQVSFHFNAPDKLAYACLFTRKWAAGHGKRIVITGDWALLQALDARLWQLRPVDFVAHCLQDAAPAVLQASPVQLCSHLQQATHQEVLLNLGAGVPEGFERFEKLVEIVSRDDPADRDLARARWRHYQSLGHAIVRHDLKLQG